MVEKSKDYVKLRELLDNKMIIPITYITLWNNETEYCYGSKTEYTMFGEYKFGTMRLPQTVDNKKFNAFCTLYDIEFEEPLKIE